MAERPALDAVLLDAGGTLVRLDFEWMAGALGSIGVDADAGRLRRAEIEGRRRYDASARAVAPGAGEAPLGAIGDVRAYFGGMLEAAGVPGERMTAALELFLARERETGLWRRPMEGARDALDRLEALGLRRAVVSNSDGRAEQHLAHSDVRRGVEFVVDSHLVGIEKPDPRILAVALERLGVAPARALFVGDIRSVDERVARAASVHFVLLDPFGDYAEPGAPAIASIAALPDWITAHFRVPLRAAGSPSQGG